MKASTIVVSWLVIRSMSAFRPDAMVASTRESKTARVTSMRSLTLIVVVTSWSRRACSTISRRAGEMAASTCWYASRSRGFRVASRVISRIATTVVGSEPTADEKRAMMSWIRSRRASWPSLGKSKEELRTARFFSA